MKKSLLNILGLSLTCIALIGCQNKESTDNPSKDTAPSTTETAKKPIAKWAPILSSRFQAKGIVEEIDKLVKPIDESIQPKENSYVIDKIEKKYSEGKKYNYDLNLSEVDYEGGETDDDGMLTEERLSLFHESEDNNPLYKGFDGYVQDTSLNQDNTIKRAFITYDWETECKNPFTDYTEDDFKYLDDSEKTFTVSDDKLESLDDIGSNLIFKMLDDPYTSIEFTEENDSLKAVIKDTTEEDSDDEGDWTYDLIATLTINPMEEEAFDCTPRKETDLSKKIDSVLNNMYTATSYTIHHKDTYVNEEDVDDSIPTEYDVKIKQSIKEDKTVDYTIANYGTKKGVAKFSNNQYYHYSWDKDEEDETKNVVEKGDLISDSESYRGVSIPKYDSISGTMFEENKNESGSYVVNEHELYGINHDVRMSIFFLLLLEDNDSKMPEATGYDNLKLYLDETDSNKPLLKSLKYDVINEDDRSVIKHVQYDYKGFNSTEISDLTFEA